ATGSAPDRGVLEPSHGRPEQKERLRPPPPLELDRAARLDREAAGERALGRAGDVDAAGAAARFQAARNVHGVAPDVVDELVPADDAGDDRAGVDADAELERGR